MSAGIRLVEVLKAYGRKVKETGRGKWLAQCPAHPDNNPSLSIGEMPDGRVLLKCHAGCANDAIVESVGLRLADLYPDGAGGEWGAMWWASNRREREAKADQAVYDKTLLEQFKVMRERGETLTKQQKDAEAEAWLRQRGQ